MLFRTDITVTHRSFRYFAEFAPRDCTKTLHRIAFTLVKRLSRLSLLSVTESNICLLNSYRIKYAVYIYCIYSYLFEFLNHLDNSSEFY